MTVGQIIGRVLAIIGGLLLIGIVLRLIVAILSPVLPEWFMDSLAGGWGTLFGILSPAMAPIMALQILNDQVDLGGVSAAGVIGLWAMPG